MPPRVTAFVLAAFDPLAGPALLACMTIMVIVLNVLLALRAIILPRFVHIP
jgi:hypothetical protein